MTNTKSKTWGGRLTTLLVALFALGRVAAQDVTIDLTVLGPRTEQGITLKYHWYEQGANISGDHTDWALDIKTPKRMARIEFVGTSKSAAKLEVADKNGTLVFDRTGTSVWTGLSDHVNIVGASSSTDYYISRLDIWYEDSPYLCLSPLIQLGGGQFSISSATADATCYGSLTPIASAETQQGGSLALSNFEVAAYAESPTCRRSTTVTEQVSIDDLFGINLPQSTRSAAPRKAGEVQTFQRNKVLVEKHTGLNCGYCPSGDAAFRGYLGRHPEHENHVIEIRHNSYGAIDFMYVPGLHSRLSSCWEVRGWPCYMVDRCDPNGNRYTNAGGYHISWTYWNGESYDPITPRYTKPTHVSLSLDGSSYDPATRQLIVHLSGQVTQSLPDLCVNVYLAQNKISGYTSDSYQHVTRAYLANDVDGDALTPIDGVYDVTYTTTLQDKYAGVNADPDNMEVIAFISSFNSEDFTYSEVHNADCVSLTSLPAVALPHCASPEIGLQDGTLHFTSETEGATYSHSYSSSFVPLTGAEGYLDMAFTVTATAHAEGHASSLPTMRTFTLRDLLTQRNMTTGVGLNDVHDLGAGAVYDLQGRRASSSARGLLISGRTKLLR